MSRLTAYLSLHYPFYQANALDGFGPYTVLGTIREDGTLSVEEAGETMLPEALPAPMEPDQKETVLIALPAVPDSCGYANALKQVGKAASEAGMKVRYCPLAEGGAGTAYALTVAARGRFEWVKPDKTAPAVLMGVMPGKTVAIDLSSLKASPEEPEGSSGAVGKLISCIWNLGYRRIMLSAEGYSDKDQGKGMLAAISDSAGEMDQRIGESSFTVLTGETGSVSFSGAIEKLVQLGADVQPAMSLLTEKVSIEELISESDILITSEHEAKRFSHPHRRIYTVSDREMHEPELLYGIFLHKYTRTGSR